jgi:hypothetical protein
MRKLTRITTSLLGAAAFATTLATPAAAQPIEGPENVLILIDMSGSMMREGQSEGVTRWADAMAAAQVWLAEYQTSAGGGDEHKVAVWGFQEGGMVPLWPLAGDCADILTVPSGRGSEDADLCVMPTAEDFQPLIDAFASGGAIDSQHPPELGGPRTNLAHGLCEMIAYFITMSGEQWSIILEADGNENFTPLEDLCYGEKAVLEETFSINPTVEDWGFQGDQTETTWQSKTMRAAVRATLPQATAVATELATGFLEGSEYCNFYGEHADYPGNTCVEPSSNLHWKVDLHQTVCEEYGYDCSPWVYAGGGTYPAMMALAGPGMALVEDPDGGYTFSPLVLMSAAAPATPLSVPVAPASFPSLPFGELGLFNTLTTSSPQSTLTVYLGGTDHEFGTDHVIPADVDDSGCADMADLQIITQEDVWLQRAILPLEIAIRADITHDGFVNYDDLNMLLEPAHWGQGCVNYPPHPEGGPSCWNSEVDGLETDLDCGGGECAPCADGRYCVVDEDCENENCIDGICGGPSPSTCTADVAIDIGAPGQSVVVDNAACIKVEDGLPSWWGTRDMELQSQWGGTFPVPFTWTSSCTYSEGVEQFTGSWQGKLLSTTSEDCPTLIQLQGEGGDVRLTYYGR